jgi:cysteine desulfurase / selenocysteine lyase
MSLRSQFPFFDNQDCVYLDSAATTQKPQCVIDSISEFYSKNNCSNHSSHQLAVNLDNQISECRTRIANFIGAKTPEEIIFTSGATSGLNLICHGFLISTLINFRPILNSTEIGLNLGLGGSYGLYEKLLDSAVDRKSMYELRIGDKILISVSEHHSNIIQWQRLAKMTGAIVEYVNIDHEGRIDLLDLESKMPDARIVCVSHASNVLGVINDIKAISKIVNKFNCFLIVDGTQAVAHIDVDMQDMNCDFYCFSGHKMYGPTGIGIVYGNADLLKHLPNYEEGGEMVESVDFEENIFKKTPYRFEAGTNNFASIIGLSKAVEWLENYKPEIQKTENYLLTYLFSRLNTVPNLIFFGSQDVGIKLPLISFTIEGHNSLDIATFLSTKDICVRSGQMCAGLLHASLGYNDSLRVSLGCYNTTEDIDKLVLGINEYIDRF